MFLFNGLSHDEREIVSQVILQELLPVRNLRDKIMGDTFVYFF